MVHSTGRRDFSGRPLQIQSEDPIEQFQNWFQDATDFYKQCDSSLIVNAMVLSTTADQQPTARVVLLKECSAEGFVFYTNYDSRKGLEINENPQVSLLFYWDAMERQIRIDGRASRIDPKRSQAYFCSRPVAAQLAASMSQQSTEVENPEQFKTIFNDAVPQVEGTLPCPDNWGGYCVVPHLVEFWQGQPNRFHDRLEFSLIDNNWQHRWLMP